MSQATEPLTNFELNGFVYEHIDGKYLQDGDPIDQHAFETARQVVVATPAEEPSEKKPASKPKASAKK